MLGFPYNLPMKPIMNFGVFHIKPYKAEISSRCPYPLQVVDASKIGKRAISWFLFMNCRNIPSILRFTYKYNK